MNVIKYSSLLILVLVFTRCASLFQFSGLENFPNKYDAFLGPNEKTVFTTYHQLISYRKDGKTILRTFYPEKKLMTAQETFADEGMNTREGEAKYWHETGFPQSEGTYENNLASGFWKYYNRKDGSISKEGLYENGNKKGIWTNYYRSGKIFETATFHNNLREGAFVVYDTLGAIINQGVFKADTIFQETNPSHKKNATSPFFPACGHIEDVELRKKCSDKLLLEYIYKELEYPSIARKYNLEGTTITSFVVDKDGSVTDIEVIKGICESLEAEAFKTIKSLPTFTPGTNEDGAPVKVQFTIPIKFRLE